jgi:predicted RNase H-like nuclease
MCVVCGADGYPGGWVVVWHDLSSGRLWWETAPSLQSIVAADPRPAVIAVDVPIGLTDAGPRECDLEARRRLGFPRSSSVFPAPIRPILAARDQVEAGTIRHSIEGKRVSIQAWAIVPRIRDVDDALRADQELRSRVREVHPELCFHFMNSERPLVYSKRRREGRTERAVLLRAHFGESVGDALATKPTGCRTDDLLDAFAITWTAARVARGDAITVPNAPPRDRFELPMEMVV